MRINRNKTKAICLSIVCVLATNACSNRLVKSFAAMNAIRQHLIQKYHDEVVVNVNNSSYLSVVFVNSALNNQSSNERWTRAQDAARFVALNYEDIQPIQQIWIAFMAAKTKFIVLHYNQVIDTFGFDKNGVSLGSAASDTSDLRAPVVRYIPNSNQTDVSITRIQLEGNMNKGVALVPHFVVSGDARQPNGEISPPEFVVFDFASYSAKPLFADNANLEIDCDGQPALKGSARLLPAAESGTTESIAQFLSVRMSFKTFNKIAHARNVKIRLEPKRFDLMPDDIGALARMTSYVRVTDAAGR